MGSTLVVSDLHLGAHRQGDVARRPDLRAPLLEAAREADQVILLGDVLEFRDGPVHAALDASRGFFEDLGDALGGRRVVLVPGNHDYELIAPWLERRRDGGDTPPLGLEQWAAPHDASPAAATIAGWLGSSELAVAYPGVWLRDDVYATHGHYADRHVAVPSFERLGARVVDRVARGRLSGARTPDDYEAALNPIYSLLHSVAQFAPEGWAGSGASERAYRILVGDGRRRPLRHLAIGALAWPVAVAALNRAGLGPIAVDLSGGALRRAAVAAMEEVVKRLGIDARWVIFGHFHRAGPFPDRDDPAEWVTSSGVQLVNSGCWLYGDLFLRRSGSHSPYWPGVCVHVPEEGAPRLERLLADRGAADIRPQVTLGPRA